MASKVHLELFLKPSKKLDSKRRSVKTPTRTSKSTARNTSSTTRETDQSPIQSINQLRNLFEVRKISYQRISEKSSKTLKKQLEAKVRTSERCSSITKKKASLKPSSVRVQEFEAAPEPIKTYYNERLLWKKRKGKNLPLCIVNINGVLGEFSRTFFPRSSKLELHEDLKTGLESLSRHFFVALISWSGRNETEVIVRTLEDLAVRFDALYIVRHRVNKYRFRHNYEAIIRDFRVSRLAEVFIVSSINLELSEIRERPVVDLFYEKNMSGVNRLTPVGVPDLCLTEDFDPLCVFVPSFLASDEKIDFLKLVKFLKKLGEENIENTAFGRIALPCEHCCVQFIPEKVENLDSGVRFVVFSVSQLKEVGKAQRLKGRKVFL